MAASVQKRVSNLREKLLAMGYEAQFTVESLDLVEIVFADLITTTESYEQLQQREEQTAQDLALSQSQLFPLKKENARLLRENNALHLGAIKAAEGAGAAQRASLLEKRVLEGQLEELTFLCKQKDLKIEEASTKVNTLQTGLQQALEGHLDRLHGARSEAVYSARPEMETNKPLKPRRARPSAPQSPRASVRNPGSRSGRNGASSANGSNADGTVETAGAERPAVAVYEELVESLRKQLRQTEERAEQLETERVDLERGVASREKEILRIGRLLDSGRDYEKVSLAHAHEANRRIVEQLNAQVDFLNGQLATREAQLMQVQTKLRTAERSGREAEKLREQVSRLQAQAKAARRSARGGGGSPQDGGGGTSADDAGATSDEDLSQSSHSDVPGTAATDRRALTQMEEQRGRLQQALDDAERRCADALARATDADRSRDASLAQKDQAEAAAAALERELRTHRDAADRLTQQLQETSQREASWRAQVESLKKETAALTGELTERQSEVSRLVEERAHLMDALGDTSRISPRPTVGADPGQDCAQDNGSHAQEYQDLRRRVQAAEALRQQDAEESADLRMQLEGVRGQLRDAEHGARALSEQVAALQSAAAAKERQVSELEGRLADLRALRPLEGEVEELRKRLRDTQEQLRQAEDTSAGLRQQLEAQRAQGSALGAEVAARGGGLDALSRERDRLGEELRARDRDIDELRRGKRALEADLSALQRRLGSLTLEGTTQAQGVMQLQSELEDRLGEVQRLRAEGASLTDRLMVEERKTLEARDEAARLQAQLSARGIRQEAAESELDKLRAVATVMHTRQLEMETSLARSEAECDRQRSLAGGLEQQLGRLRGACQQRDEDAARLKVLCKQIEGSRETLKAKLEAAHKRLQDAEARAAAAMAERDALQRDLETARGETAALRSALHEVDADRDAAQSALDRQQESAVEADQHAEHWRAKLAQAEARARDQGSRLSALKAALEESRGKLRDAQQQLADLRHEHQTLSAAHSLRTSELRAAAEDLELMTRENQAVTGDAAKAAAEADALRQQLQQANHEMGTAQQARRAAEFERDDAMATYKALYKDHKRLQTAKDELDQSRQRLTQGIAARDAEIAKLRARLRGAEAELHRKTVDLGTVQRQLEDLSEQLRRAQRQMEGLQSDNRKLAQEIYTHKAHASSLTERVMGQGRASAVAVEEVSALRSRIKAVEQERDGLSRLLQRERLHTTALEQLVEACRSREAGQGGDQSRLLREKMELERQVRELQEELGSTTNSLATLSASRSRDRHRTPRQPGSGNSARNPSSGEAPGIGSSMGARRWSAPQGGTQGVQPSFGSMQDFPVAPHSALSGSEGSPPDVSSAGPVGRVFQHHEEESSTFSPEEIRKMVQEQAQKLRADLHSSLPSQPSLRAAMEAASTASSSAPSDP